MQSPLPHQNTVFTKATLLASVVAFLLLALAKWLVLWRDGAFLGPIVFTDFVVIPVVMGLLFAWYCRRNGQDVSRKNLLLMSLVLTLSAILQAAMFMGEGIVCLIIVAPLLFVFIGIGMFAGLKIFANNNQKLQVSTWLLLASIFVFDTFSEHHYEELVSDEITINAPAHVVWEFVPEYPLNTKAADDYWLWRVGLPAPVQSVGGTALNAKRQCVFSNGAIFEEVVTEFTPNERYTFEVTHQPADPEIIGHITLKKGQFLLKDNGNGTTTLVGNSWYQLHVFPAWYYGWWATDITRNVHIRVMQHIAKLAEDKNRKL